MKNYVSPGEAIDIAAAPFAVDAGEIVVVGAIVGVAAADALISTPVTINTTGIFDLAKVPAVVFTQGEIVYTGAAGGPVTDNSDADSNSGAAVKVGYAVRDAGVGAASVRVRLVPVV